MPEDQQQNEQPITFEVPDKPWLERDQWYVCCVALGGDDHVDLLAVSGELTDELQDLIEIGLDVLPDGREDMDELEVVRHALKQGLSDAVWCQLDKLLTRYVKDWDLSTYADQTRQPEPDPPGEMGDADEREAMLKSLPIPIMARILYGLAWHTRNFT